MKWKGNKKNMRIVMNSEEVIWNPEYSSKIAYHIPDYKNLLNCFSKNTQS